jgi:signal transduction histidine kinase/ligand-binding sensor domain-containing protein
MVLNMGSALRKATVQGHSASAHPLRRSPRRRSERRCPWCVLLCFWLCLLGGWAQPQSLPRPGKISSPPTAATPLSIAQPALQTYTDQQGLPQNSIRALVRDQQGRLWAATQDGAAYFDGHLWTPVPVPRALGSNFVTALAVTGDSVWLGTPNGLCRYDALAHPSQPWRVFSLGSERANNITALLAIPDDRAGGLWIGTHDGLFRFRDERWERPPAALPLQGCVVQCLGITDQPAPSLWVGTQDRGLWRQVLGTEQWEPLTTAEGLPANNITCLSRRLAPDSVWVGTVRGAALVVGRQVQPLSGIPAELATLPINAMLEVEGPDGRPLVWIGTNQGLYAQAGGQWRRYATAQGLSSDLVRSLFISQPRSGGIWIGQGGGGGVTYLHHGAWWSLSKAQGLPSNMAWCAEVWDAADGTEILWAGTLAGLARWERGTWATIGPEQGFPADNVRTLLTTGQPGRRVLWIGTATAGLWQLAENRRPLRASRVESIPADAHIHVLCPSRTATTPARLYVGTNRGLLALRPDTGESESLGLDNEAVYTVAETPGPDGEVQLWAGLDQGIACRTAVGWKRFELGLSGQPMVNALHVTRDAAGHTRLWGGLQGGGLVCLEPGDPPQIIEHINTRTTPALPNDVVYHLFEDDHRRLWATTNRGVVCLALDGAREGSERALKAFTMEDGLPSNECNFGRAGCDRRGRAWVGTVRGLAVLNTHIFPAEETPGKLLVHITTAEDALLSPSPRLAFPHTLRDLSFHFILPVLRRGQEVMYRTQLVPYDAEPTPWTGRTRRDCSNLPSGNYTLTVWARDATGQMVRPVTLSFSIQAAPWRQPWAYVLYALALFGFGYALYDLRVRQIRRHQELRIAALRQLLDSTRVINSTLDVGEVLRKIASESALLVRGEPGGIGLVEGDRLVFRHIWNGEAWEDCEVPFPLGKGVAGSVAATGKPRIVNDVRTCPDLAHPELIEVYGVHGIVDVPIRNRSGVTIGVLDIRRPPGREPFTERDSDLIEGLTHQAAVAIENATINRQLREAAERAERLYRREQEVVARMQELDVMKNNFLAVTSHEMRTPLTVIKGFLEAMAFGAFDPPTERQQMALATCLKTTDRLARIVEDIFEVLKIQEGYIGLQREPVVVESLLREILQEVSVFTSRRRQQVLFVASGNTQIEGDAHKLNLSFLNIIQNAIKFTPDGGEIAVTVTGGETFVTVEIADNGIGIDAADLPHIFERFYTGRDTSRHSSGRFEFNTRGTGLGLTIAKSYIDAHGGGIEVMSDGPGQGSRFTITLPRVQPQEAESRITMAIARIE